MIKIWHQNEYSKNIVKKKHTAEVHSEWEERMEER